MPRDERRLVQRRHRSGNHSVDPAAALGGFDHEAGARAGRRAAIGVPPRLPQGTGWPSWQDWAAIA